VHTTGFFPVHTPPWQVSVCVQAFPSLHAVPSALAGLEHVPVAGSQVPATWHWSEALQTAGLRPRHTSASQVSVCVQASPSSQVVPSPAGIPMQRPASQLSPVVHWLPSSQAVPSATAVPRQVPAWQLSCVVHALSSSQAVPSATTAPTHVPPRH